MLTKCFHDFTNIVHLYCTIPTLRTSGRVNFFVPRLSAGLSMSGMQSHAHNPKHTPYLVKACDYDMSYF